MMMKSAADFFPFKAYDLFPNLCEISAVACELMTNACDFQAYIFDSPQSIKNNEKVGIGMPIPYTFLYIVPGISIMDILNGV